MAATQVHGVQDIQIHNKEHDVIDLSVLPLESDDVVAFDQGGATTAAEAAGTSMTVGSFRGLRLKDFDMGERLGAKRDGGGGYQGCNSRVFRVRLRRPWQREEMGSSGASCGATAKAEESEGKEIRFPRGVAASSSPLQIPHGKIIGGNNRAFSNRGFGRIKRLRSIFHANGYDDGGSGGAGASRLSGAAGRYDGSDPAAEAGYQTPDRPRENAGVSAAASEPIGLAGRLFRGSFGACFSGHGQTSDDELTPLSRGNERSGGVSGVRLDQPGEIAPREFALKMALTLRGQDPAQVQREMATEIAVLVGGRIPPHENIIRGIHSFQDEIGDDLQPVLWSGLGPRAGEDLNPRTSFLVMPLFTAGSLQALLNKRLGRCAGPPFLRLLDAMRFLEQMLSAVGHLLEHGLAHNDIKPDNWLLTNDQRSLVLTDFGSCVDSLQPLPLPTPLPTASASLPTTSAVALNPHEQPLIPQTYGAIVAPVIERAPSSAEGSEYNQGSTRTMYGGCGALSGTCAQALNSAATASTPTLTPWVCSASADRGREADAARADATAFVGRSPTSGSGNVEMVSVGAPSTPRTKSDDSHSPGAVASPAMTSGDERQRKGCHFDSDGGVRSSSSKRRDLAESLVFPFSDYFSAGAPSFLAPELERAWRERGVLDFRRSDVYSVGVCMYHMLRPGGPETDTRSELLEKQGTLPHQRESSVVREWPLPIFPDDVGGCPFEVAQLCHGLLQRDPTCRVSASEGHSLATWLVSRLKAAEPRDDVRSMGSTPAVPVTAQGGDDGRDRQQPKGRLLFPSYRPIEARRGDTCPGSFGAPGRGSLGLLGKRSRDEDEAGVSRKILCDGFGRGFPAAVMKEGAGEKEGGSKGLLKAAGEAQESQIVEDGLYSRKREGAGDPDHLVRADRVSQMRFCFARAAPEELFEALQARGWDVQVACDAFGHGGEGPRSNSTRCPIEIEDGDAPATSPWRASTFEMPLVVVPNRSQGTVSVDRKPRPPEMLWFNGVAKELRGRIRTAAVSPFRRREFSHLDRRQPPVYPDRSLGI